MKVHNLSGTSRERYNEYKMSPTSISGGGKLLTGGELISPASWPYNKHPYGYDSWKEYWEDMMGQKFSYCSHTSCFNEAAGGHVQKDDFRDRSWYIVPLCKACNNTRSDRYFDVNEEDLCPVNK